MMNDYSGLNSSTLTQASSICHGCETTQSDGSNVEDTSSSPLSSSIPTESSSTSDSFMTSQSDGYQFSSSKQSVWDSVSTVKKSEEAMLEETTLEESPGQQVITIFLKLKIRTAFGQPEMLTVSELREPSLTLETVEWSSTSEQGNSDANGRKGGQFRDSQSTDSEQSYTETDHKQVQNSKSVRSEETTNDCSEVKKNDVVTDVSPDASLNPDASLKENENGKEPCRVAQDLVNQKKDNIIPSVLPKSSSKDSLNDKEPLWMPEKSAVTRNNRHKSSMIPRPVPKENDKKQLGMTKDAPKKNEDNLTPTGTTSSLSKKKVLSPGKVKSTLKMPKSAAKHGQAGEKKNKDDTTDVLICKMSIKTSSNIANSAAKKTTRWKNCWPR